MRRATGEGVEVEREGRHEGFTFTGLHLGDLPLMEHNAADNLNVEGHHVPGQLMPADFAGRSHQPPARILDRGERFRQEVIERLALGETLPKLRGLALEFFLG